MTKQKTPSVPPIGTIEVRGGKFRVRLPRALDPSRASRTFETRELAEKFLRGASAVIQDASPNGHDTLASYVPDWIDRRELSGIRSVRRERSVWRSHIEGTALASMPLASITKHDVREWLESLAKKTAAPRGHLRAKPRKLSKQTREHALKLVRGAIVDARERGVLPESFADPTLGQKIPKPPSTEDEWTFLSADEIRRVLECDDIPESFKNIFTVGVYTGLRTGELWGLRWANVELDGDRPQLVVRFSHDGPTKTGKVRRVPLLAPALAVLRRMRAALPKRLHPDRLVFTTKRGYAIQKSDDAGWGDRKVTAYYAKRYAEKGEKAPEYTTGWKTIAGIERPVRFYDATRHTFASHLVMGTWGTTWTLQEVAAMLGHTDIEVTTRYAHLSPDHLSRKARDTTRFWDQKAGPKPVSGSSANVDSPAKKPGRAIVDSNHWPSAPEAHKTASDLAALDPLRDQLGTRAVRMLAEAVLSDVSDTGSCGVPLATAFDVAMRRLDPSYPPEPTMTQRLRAAALATRAR